MVDVQLDWSPSPATHDEERVYKATVADPTFPGDYTQIATLDPATGEYTDPNVTENTTLHYAVTAFDGEESTTDPSYLVTNSLDTETDIDDFFTETVTNRAKTTAVSSPVFEGSGAMRINQDSEADNTFYGTAGFHYLDERSEYPSDGLTQCHITYYARLDSNYEIDSPFGGQQAGKGFPGFDGRWEGDASEEDEPWVVNGAIWSADAIGESADDWLLSYYLYDSQTDTNEGTTYHPSIALKRDRWYKIDRFIDVTNDILKQWYDGQLVIDLDSSDVQFSTVDPYDKVYAIRNLFYYGGGWGAPSGSGDNYSYLDYIRVSDSEESP